MTSADGPNALQLPAQLGADRAAGSGHQHPPPRHVAGDRDEVDVGLVAAEQIGHRQRADVGRVDAADEIGHRRDDEDPQSGVEPRRRDLPQALAGDLRIGHEDGAGAVTGGHAADVGARALHAQAVEAHVRALRVVVQHGDGPVRALGRARAAS